MFREHFQGKKKRRHPSKNNLPLNSGRALCFTWSTILQPTRAHFLSLVVCQAKPSITRLQRIHVWPGVSRYPFGSVNRESANCFNVVFFVRKSLKPILRWQVSLLIAAKWCCRCHCEVADSGSVLNDKAQKKSPCSLEPAVGTDKCMLSI